jgi:hypothetical protein
LELKEMMKHRGLDWSGSEYEQEGSSHINMAVDSVGSVIYAEFID